MCHPLRHGGINRILTHIPLDAEIIRIGALILRQRASLHFILMRSIPRPEHDLAAATHGLRVRRHHADGAEIVQHVLGGDSLSADARLGERDVLRDVARQVVAHHEHVEVLIERVARKGPRRVRRAR